MAYPSIASSTKGFTTTNALSTSITVPSGTQAGDLMILIIVKDGTGVFTTPTDWTMLRNTAGAAQTTGVFYRILTGALSNFTISHASEMTAWTVLRIARGDVPTINTRANGSSVNPNPASHTHGLGTGAEVLWIALAGWDYNRTCSAYPWTGGNDTERSTATGGAGLARCTMTSTNASEDAGNFTISAIDTWDAYTIAVILVPLTQATGGATITPTGTISRQLTLARLVGEATLNVVGDFYRTLTAYRIVGGASLTPTATLQTVFVAFKNVGEALLTPGATLVKLISTVKGQATLTPAASVSKLSSKSAGLATLTPTAVVALTVRVSQTVGQAAVTMSAIVSKLTQKTSGQATITPLGTQNRLITINVGNATLNPTGNPNKHTQRLVGLALITPTAAITAFKTVASAAGQAILTPISTVSRLIYKIVGQATVTPAGAVATGEEEPVADSHWRLIVNKLFKTLKDFLH